MFLHCPNPSTHFWHNWDNLKIGAPQTHHVASSGTFSAFLVLPRRSKSDYEILNRLASRHRKVEPAINGAQVHSVARRATVAVRAAIVTSQVLRVNQRGSRLFIFTHRLLSLLALHVALPHQLLQRLLRLRSPLFLRRQSRPSQSKME